MLRARPPARTVAALPADATVAAVVPVFDEAVTIAGVLEELRRAGIVRVIVVDGGSSDGTAEIARADGAVVVSELRRGYGRACAAGAEVAASDIVVFLDGDGSDDPAFVPQLLHCILEDGAVLALGARSGREPGALLAHQMLGNRLVSLLVRVLHGVHIDDVPPLRAIRADVLRSLELREMTYGWPTEMIVKTAAAGLPIAQVHVRTRRRAGGESKIAGRLWPSVMAGLGMMRVVLRAR